MVVSSNPSTDTTETIKTKDSDDNLTLEFKKKEVVLEQPIENKLHTLEFQKNVESGLQIQYTSLKLKNFPIIESNLSVMNKSLENVNFNNVNVLIGDELLYNVDVKIHNYEKFKMLELRTREFRVSLSAFLNADNVLEADGNGYFKYEIFSKIKNSRLFHVIKIFQKIFSGDTISFNINDLKVALTAENRLRYHKFIMMENSLNSYLNTVKKLHLPKAKNLSETNLSFYTLHLLDEYLKENQTIDSWISFSIPNTEDVKPGDSIDFERIHKLDFKGIKFDLKETVHLKEPIKESELIGNKINCSKKTVQIKLEKIERI